MMATTSTQPPAEVPPAVRRLGAWFLVPIIGLPIVLLLPGIPAVKDWLQTPSPWVGVSIPVAIFSPVFVTILALWLGQRRIRRAVGAASGRACVRCLQDLNGLGDAGTCPKCGRRFDISADQRSWARVNMHR